MCARMDDWISEVSTCSAIGSDIRTLLQSRVPILVNIKAREQAVQVSYISCSDGRRVGQPH